MRWPGALGATHWESMHLTMLNSLSPQFAYAFIKTMRLAFFEGLTVFFIILYFFNQQNPYSSFWGHNYVSYIAESILLKNYGVDFILPMAAILIILRAIFYWAESTYRLKGGEL